MATTSPMYSLNPIYHANAVQNLPTCMYRLGRVCADDSQNCAESSHTASTEVQVLLARQNAIIAKLEALKERVDSLVASSSSTDHQPIGNKAVNVDLPKDLVIRCNPAFPALAVLYLTDQLSTKYNVLRTVYTHSTARAAPCIDLSKVGFQSDLVGVGRAGRQMILTWVWQDCDDCEMLVSPLKHTKIMNESNVCRYLLRLLGGYPTNPVQATKLDSWIDAATHLTSGTSSAKANVLAQLAKHMSSSAFVAGHDIGVEDIIIWSAFARSVTSGKWANDAKLKKWSGAVSQRVLLRL